MMRCSLNDANNIFMVPRVLIIVEAIEKLGAGQSYTESMSYLGERSEPHTGVFNRDFA